MKTLFDTSEFEEWMEKRNEWLIFSNWDRSPLSNSFYSDVTAIIGTDDNFIEIEFKLRISDHSVYKDGVTVPVDVDYCAMPTSTALSADGSTWEDIPNVTWNRKSDWKEILIKIESYLKECCPTCGLHAGLGGEVPDPCPACEERRSTTAH